jgi:methionyl-tRNA formyltransferase
MDKRSDNNLGILLLTRTGRPSGEKILKGLTSANKRCVGVVAERRTSMLLRRGFAAFIRDSIKNHGLIFVMTRAIELVMASFKTERIFLEDYCEKNRIPFYLVDNHNSESTRDILLSCKPDVLITANTRIITNKTIKIPAKAALNFHTSKLPKYAGLDSIFWALYYRENEIGVSIHYLEKGLDTGDIVTQETIPVLPDDTIETLTEKAHDLGSQLVLKAIEKFENGDFKGVPQDIEQRTYFSWPTPAQRKELRRIMRQGVHGNRTS